MYNLYPLDFEHDSKIIQKIGALIPIKLSRPNPERSICGNRLVPLNGSQFSKLHPRTRKTYDILVYLENNSLPILKIYKHLRFCRKFGKTPFKTRISPYPRKIVYKPQHISINGKPSTTYLILISKHNPSIKKLRRR